MDTAALATPDVAKPNRIDRLSSGVVELKNQGSGRYLPYQPHPYIFEPPMKIPFSPPFITDQVFQHVQEVLESGWITTGPKSRALEQEFTAYTEGQASIAVNSWSSGAILALKWLGIQLGDEVIIPAYTYAATALSVLHAGATPVMCDSGDDFCLDPKKLSALITERTKAIIPVDFGGLPADYSAIRAEVEAAADEFEPTSRIQEKFGRIAILTDAAHSLGARWNGLSAAMGGDITIYSTHAVKNLTTAEGGMIVLNLPPWFEVELEEKWFTLHRLNGQTKDAFAKSKAGGWRYDIVTDGMKMNMPDICAAIGLGQIVTYPSALRRRREIFERYESGLDHAFFRMPVSQLDTRQSSYHLFAVRLHPEWVAQRDEIIDFAAAQDVAVNVHFIPLPELTLFKELGYSSSSVPQAVSMSNSEISLPIYPQMTNEMADRVIEVMNQAARATKKVSRADRPARSRKTVPNSIQPSVQSRISK